MQISKNQAAFATVTVLAAATAGSVFAFVATISAAKAASVAFGVLGITCAGASIASITAWCGESQTAGDYFETFKSHAGIAIAGTYQLVAQTLLQALIQGIGQGIASSVRRAIAGPDFTIQQQ